MGQSSSSLEEIQPSNEEVLPAFVKRIGLRNLGNSCYCNSVLQALLNCDSFKDKVLEFYDEQISTNRPKSSWIQVDKSASLLEALAKLFVSNSPSKSITSNCTLTFEILQNSIARNAKSRGSISPNDFLRSVHEANEMFRGTMHQDAHEFLNFLLNEIIDNLRQHWNSKKSLKTSINSIEENKASIEERKTNFQSDEKNSSDSSGRTFIQEIFEGSLISETQCLRCETITSRTEPFLDLSIEIENHTSLSYCLGQFSKNEMLCRDEKYYCSCCCSRQEAYRRMKIKSVPEVLIFHMKRFKYVESEYAFRKLCYRVVFPFELKLFHSVDESVDKNLGYELIAVIVHIGNLLKFGHYVCFVKVLGKWILYDDDRTEIVNEEAIRSCFGRVKSQHHQDGYILFYRKMQ